MSPESLVKPTCPHCWARFEPYETLWIASLRGDVRLGDEAFRRFRPSRFSPEGDAIDERGKPCNKYACPACHLPLPGVCLELEPLFVSVFGTPASGKSYYLAAMAHNLRRLLLEQFRVNFTDANAAMNQIIIGYEQSVFAHPTPNEEVPLGRLIAKTQEVGDMYNVVTVGADRIQYPKPFMFKLVPADDHPLADDPGPVSRLMCLYDNAGESFLIDRDSDTRPVTRHLAQSALLLFLFDPIQHSPFRQRLGTVASDLRGGTIPQDLVLAEAADLIRRFAHLRHADRQDCPLIVVVTKKDLWGSLVPELNTREPVIAPTSTRAAALNLGLLERQSGAIRQLLVDLAPEVVNAAEALASPVFYVGVSSLGTAPTQHPETKQWSIRPSRIRPDGVEIPILYGLNLQFPRLIPGGRRHPPSTGGLPSPPGGK